MVLRPRQRGDQGIEDMKDDPPLSQINIIRERQSDGTLAYKMTLFTDREVSQVIYIRHRVLVLEAVAEVLPRLTEPVKWK